MADVLAVLCALSAGYCLARCLDSRWRYGHSIGLDAWHVAMAAAMAAMLLGTGLSLFYAVVFGAGAAWCAWSVWARRAGVAHLRLGVALSAMAVMLVPTAALGLPRRSRASRPRQRVRRNGSDHRDVAGLVAVAVGVAALLALRAPEGNARVRLGLACEVVMAAALGWMAATAL